VILLKEKYFCKEDKEHKHRICISECIMVDAMACVGRYDAPLNAWM